MSWRLWYRESTSKEQLPVPIPIQNTKAQTNEKPLSPSSFTKIISSLNENQLVVPQRCDLTVAEMPKPSPIMTEMPHPPRLGKFFINDNESDFDDESDWSSDDESTEEECGSITKEQVILFPSSVLDNVSEEDNTDENDNDYETVDEDNDSYETVVEDAENNTNEVDEIAFLLEFKKRSPGNMCLKKRHSLLSNMLRAQTPPDCSSKSSNGYLSAFRNSFVPNRQLNQSSV